MAGRAVQTSHGRVSLVQIPQVSDIESARTAMKMLYEAVHDLQARSPIYSGKGSPEGVVTAAPGSVYTSTDGGAGTTLYVKESGIGNTGWVAK